MQWYADEVYLSWVDKLAADDFVIIDNYIKDDMFRLIQSFFNEQRKEDELVKAGIGSLGDHAINACVRGDYIYWLDKSRDARLEDFYRMVEELIEKLNRYCFLSISDFEFHLAYYPEGTFYKKHLDQFRGRNNRIISFVLYLNENWQKGDGGELKIFGDHEQEIEPLAKRLVLFKSAEVEHEVLLANQPRFSLTGWLLNNPVGIGYI